MCASRSNACGVCRTDLHVVDGELPGHRLSDRARRNEVVGRVDALGPGVTSASYWRAGRRSLVGLYLRRMFPIAGAAGKTLCDRPALYRLHARRRLCHAPRRGRPSIAFRSARPATMSPSRLYCARPDRLALAGDGRRWKASRHLRLRCGRAHHCAGGPLAGALGHVHPRGDVEAQHLAKCLARNGRGHRRISRRRALDAAIIFAPVGDLVPLALRAVRKGGRLWSAPAFCMSDIPLCSLSLSSWEERQLLSVANLTRGDGTEFFDRGAGGHQDAHQRVSAARSKRSPRKTARRADHRRPPCSHDGSTPARHSRNRELTCSGRCSISSMVPASVRPRAASGSTPMPRWFFSAPIGH